MNILTKTKVQKKRPTHCARTIRERGPECFRGCLYTGRRLSLSSGDYDFPQARDAIQGNPKGIVPSSPGLRACELTWEIAQTASQPQRGCARARDPRTQPAACPDVVHRGWGWAALTRHTHFSLYVPE